MKAIRTIRIIGVYRRDREAANFEKITVPKGQNHCTKRPKSLYQTAKSLYQNTKNRVSKPFFDTSFRGIIVLTIVLLPC